MRSKRLTAEQKADIVRLYKQGVVVEDIMIAVGCSKPTAYKYIKKAELSREIPEDNVQEAIRLYKESDLTVAEICRRTNISKPTFYRRLKKEIQE